MIFAIILSGGIGLRMGAETPKQYIEVQNHPIIYYCIRAFLSSPMVDAVIIGLSEEWRPLVASLIDELAPTKPIWFSKAGETRQYSIYNALKEAQIHHAAMDDVVIIHDAARPLVSLDLIEDCLDGCREAEGVLPVIPVKDTLYRSVDGCHISNLLNRQELFAGQAPEAFRFGRYLALHEQMTREELLKINGSTEIAYKGGMSIKLIKGDEMNFKITTPEDLSNFESIIKTKNNESLRTTSGE